MIACTSNPLCRTKPLPVYGKAAEWICLIAKEYSAQLANNALYRKDISALLLGKSVSKSSQSGIFHIRHNFVLV